MDTTEEVLNLSNSKLKKLNKGTKNENHFTELVLDDNELQRLDNIDSFVKLEKLSVCRNQLLRMYGVCRLHSLHTLNLSDNGILMIEGLKELTNLKWLCLSRNSIKTIEHLNTNTNLEHLDLSENNITHISDLSFLKKLKVLFLHKNKINHLGQCDQFLPVSLNTLTLANNNIGDLNELSRLSHLVNLTKISIANNPCVNITGNKIGFDYRPFVINWCLNVNVIDDYVVDAIESLRAEWLYSQGRGRHFRIGDQRELVNYLATVCPLTGETLETEDDRKLRLILSKAQHHQQQLREQSSNSSPHPSPATRKRIQQSKNSPRINSLRMGSGLKTPDRMAMSCYNTLGAGGDSDNSIMTQSLDASLLGQTITNQKTMTESFHANFTDAEPINSPLQAFTKMVPVPESLMSPDYRPSPLIGKITKINNSTPVKTKKSDILTRSPKSNRSSSPFNKSHINDLRKENETPSPMRQRKVMDSYNGNKKTSILRNKSPSSEEESELCDSKLCIIQNKVEERRMQKTTTNDEKVRQAAICIQKMWRGYYTRNKDKDLQEMFKVLQNHRANQYIQKLSTDMETTKAALESERKIQMLQTEAISALWKKISSLQDNEVNASTSNINMTNLNQNNSDVVKNLAQTCSVMQDQIQQLQGSMQDILKIMTIFSQNVPGSVNKENGIGTQTEIVAVHTPQGEAAKVFPFQKHQNLHQSRPSSLPLPVSQRKKENTQTGPMDNELRQYAGILVDGVIKTVSETAEIQEEIEPETTNQNKISEETNTSS
ncbi:unnamed protein product [Ceutorhynchus assimilis]|uniref:Centrosomal protein of 97 kDa n=1 Tax=Ceutorhynchus assimilis TaxID=467358 RepID=A0A9N9QNK9_9CUCU|nr:unnamed protein product [Ceutorhynchus assimilis]